MLRTIKSFLLRLLIALLVAQGAIASNLLAPSTARADAAPAVVINEVMWMGTTASASDEWLELRNTTAAVVDISEWQLTNAATSGGTLTLPADTNLAPGDFYLISNFSATSASSILDVVPDWTTTSLALNNSCSQIDLLTSDLTLVDSMGCSGGSYFFPADSSIKHGLERNISAADGLSSSSWHESVGFANLDATAAPDNLATPAFINDTTAAVGTVVNDLYTSGGTVDVAFTDSDTALIGSWTDFVDSQSGITDYEVNYATSPAGPVILPSWQSVGLVNEATITQPAGTFTNHSTYYFVVRAINGVNLVSDPVFSNGVTVDQDNPLSPTNGQSADVPGDNGGSVKVSWTPSLSADVTSYAVSYQKTSGGPATEIMGITSDEAVVGGLENNVDYDFSVWAVDFSGRTSAFINAGTTQALDNLAPIIDPALVVVSQNKPGTADTIGGVAGASNESNATVTVLSAAPGDPTAMVLGSVLGNADGSFAALGIGDNQYGSVWLQLQDASGNLSLPVQLTNDIVGPTAPLLNKAVADCQSDNCRVTLDWATGSLDTVSYRVVYTVDGADHQTMEQSGTSLALDLPTAKTYQFRVAGYDQFGNPSAGSNLFSITLTKGVRTTVVRTASGVETTTEAISGSSAASQASAPSAPAEFIPSARAANPGATAIDTTSKPSEPLVNNANNQNDWVRIMVVVILLIIIAGSFYALSRSIQEEPEATLDKSKKAKTKAVAASPTRRRRKRRRRS